MFPLLAQAAATEDIRDIVVLAPEESIWPLLFWILIGFTLLGLTVWLILYLIKKQKMRAQEFTPEAIVLRSLSRLQEEVETKEPNAFGLEVSETLKNFLVAKFNDPIRYETAEEFLNRFADSSATATRLPTSIHQNLRTFVRASEEIKFSKSPDTASKKGPLLALATNIVSLIQAIDESAQKAKNESII